VSEVVEHRPSKYEALNSYPNTVKKKKKGRVSYYSTDIGVNICKIMSVWSYKAAQT
jgi:hypothetical protein